MRRWRGLLLGAVMLLMACGLSSAQNVNVLSWTNGTFTVTSGVGTVSGWHLNSSAQVFVVGVYVDNNALYGAVTFGGAAPSGSMVVQTSGTARMAVFYWLNPNTSAGQSLVVNYGASNPAYYWAYQLSGVNIAAPVVTSGTYVANAASTSLTTSNPDSLVLSFYTVNAGGGATALTPNSPLVQVGSTIGNLSTGASIASATNTLATPGTETTSWSSTIGNNNQGVASLAFTPGVPGAPSVLSAAANPTLTAPGLTFEITATVLPGIGNVTNVSVDLTAIGGSAANNLVLSNNNVWTNTFTVPGGAPVGNASLLVTATQDVSPSQGANFCQLTVLAAATPTIVKDTSPTNLFSMYVGQGVTFSAYFTGPGLITNQWQADLGSGFADVPGATNNTYTVPSAQMSDTGFYQLQASDSFGSAVSTFTYVTVYNASTALYIWSAPIPFAGLTAEQILTNFPSTNKIAGAMVAKNGGSPINVILTNANNQPVVFGGAGSWASLSGGLGYATGANNNKSGNTSFDSALNNMYSGSPASPSNFKTITLSGLVVGKQYQAQLFAFNDSIASPSYVNFADPLDVNQITSENFGMADNVYMLGTFTATNTVMTIQQNDLNSSGSINAIVLRTVGWDPAPYIVQSPANVGAFPGVNVQFSGSAADDTTIAENSTITYQWASGPVGGPYTPLVEGAKYAGVTTPTLTVSNVVFADADVVYVLQAQNGVGTTTSREARLYVQSPPIPPAANSFAGAALAMTNNNLVGLWQLDETNDPSTGLLLAYDYSASHHSGLYGTTARNAFNGQYAPQPPTYAGFYANQGALQTGVGGTSDTNSVVFLPPLNTTNGVGTTICMWINPAQNVGYACGLLFSRYSNSGEQVGFGYCNGNNTLGFLWNNSSGQATYNYDSTLRPPNNTWNFVALVIRTNSATFYLMYVDANGAAQFGTAVDPANYTQVNWSGNSIWLGGDQYPGGAGAGAGRIFPGRISNVAMFNSALTANQLQDLFAAGFQTVGFPATISPQPPATQTNYTGFTVQIRAGEGGTLPITNQWSFNGTNLVDGWNNGSIIVGSTSNVLTILNVSSNWQGVYSLAITNSISGTVSSNSTLTILPPTAPPAGNLVGEWFAGAQNLTNFSGYLPGIHDGTQIKTNGVAVGKLTWSSDLPPNTPSGGSSLLLTNAGVLINNTSTNDAGYEATFDAGISNAMTITFWAKGWPGGWNPFVSKYGETGPSPAGGWQVRNDGNNNVSPAWTMRGNPGTTVLGTAVFGNPEDTAATSLTYGNDGKWHFYCATYDLTAGQRMLYVDGSLVAYTTGQGQYTTVPLNSLVIGARDQGGTNGYTGYYTGKIYDVRIYNVALSGADQAYIVGAPPLPAQRITSSVTPASGGNPGQMVLTWLPGGMLLQTTNVAGPWVTNQAATSPYTIVTTNSLPEFYKVLFP